MVAAVRARNKGMPDARLRDQFLRAEKDVLFLYHLHEQVNMRAIGEQECQALKLALLSEKLRTIIGAVYTVDAARLERFTFPQDLRRPLPKRKKSKQELELEGDIVNWAREEKILWGEVMTLLEASRLVSARYLAGEELLYPDSLRKLETTIAALAGLRETHNYVLDSRPPESEAAFVRWLAEDKDEPKAVSSPSAKPDLDVWPRTRTAARALAEHFVLIARAKALDDLGRRDAGIELVKEWMRSDEGRAAMGDRSPWGDSGEEASPK